MKFQAGILLLFLLCAVAHAEDPPEPIPSPEEPVEIPTEAATIDVSTPTPVPTELPPDEQNVEPLDAWHIVPNKSPTPTPVEKATDANSRHDPKPNGAAEEEMVEVEVFELENVETDAQLPENAANKEALDTAQRAHRAQLTKSQKARLRKARIRRHYVMREAAKKIGIHRTTAGDPRGETEIRVCTVNFNNYGAVDDYKRIFKAAQLPRRERIESGLLSAIVAGKCDIVGFQSLLGTSDSSAELAMKQLLRKLTGRTGGKWESFLGKKGRQVVRNGYLVRTDRVTVKNHTSYDEVRLTTFGPFSLTEFPRSPVLLTAEVPGKGSTEPKELVMLNYDFRQSLVSSKPEPEQFRMQIADGVRQIIHTVELSYSQESLPIFILLGDRMGPQPAPATQLLEGKLRLIDFTVDGGCALTPENKVQCKTKPAHLKEFYGISSEGYLLSPKVKKKKKEEGETEEKRVLVYPSKAKERKARKIQREKTSEVYLRGEDLVYAQEKMQAPGRYRSGTLPSRTGLDQSPLVWMDLNW